MISQTFSLVQQQHDFVQILRPLAGFEIPDHQLCRAPLTRNLTVAYSNPIGDVQITRPTDFKSLCLTSRDIRDVAVRKLYRKAFLDIEGAKAIRVSGFLARDNPGIPYVRDVTVYFLIFSDANERAAQLKQAHFVVRMLLEILPLNSLEAFRWAFSMF